MSQSYLIVEFLFQITLASREEYLEKIKQIKQDPAIREFLQKHQDSISQCGVLHEKLRLVFIHILKTREGEKTLIHLWTEMGIMLRDENVLKMIQTILSTSEHILTSEQGYKGVTALAEYLKSALTVHSLFELVPTQQFYNFLQLFRGKKF